MRAAHLLFIAFVLARVLPVTAQQPSLEYDVKAAFILNFVRYVEWPAANRQPPLQICVLGANPFGDRLATVVAGELWQDGAIEIQALPDLRRATACHLLYVPLSATARFTSGAALLAGRAVLTVGEHEQFLDQGGIIRLFVEDNRVRFSVNQQSADRAGLHISSRLLRLARAVIGTSQ